MGINHIHNVDEMIRHIREDNRDEMHLVVSDISDDDARRIGAALRNNTQLKTLNLVNKGISDEGAIVLAAGLLEHPTIQNLSFHANRIGNKGIRAIATVLRHNPHITSLSVGGNDFDDTGVDSLAEGLRRNQTLQLFMCGSSKISKAGLDTLEQAFLESRNKNLTSVGMTGTTYAQLKHMIAKNKAISDGLVAKIHRMPLKEWTADDLREMNDRMPSLVANGGIIRDKYEAVIKALPGWPQPSAQMPETLFWPDESGFAPLDNPRLFADEEAARKALEELPLTPQSAGWQTEKGARLFEAFAYRMDGKAFVRHLNERGIQLGAEDLLTHDGKPNTLFTLLLDRHQESALFSRANWLGKSTAELGAVYEALPRYARDVGYQVLRGQLSNSGASRAMGR